MRHRQPSPIVPFDLVPLSVVDTAKRLFPGSEIQAGTALGESVQLLGFRVITVD